jgi:hypothetical protein
MTLTQKPKQAAAERAFLSGAQSTPAAKRQFQMRLEIELLSRIDDARRAAYQSRAAYIVAAVRAQLDRDGY